MKRLILALVVTIGLCYLLVQVVDVELTEVRDEVMARLPKLRVLPLVAAFFVYASTYVARGFRLALLLGGDYSLVHMAAVAARHNLFNLLLPMRSGEASLPWMLRSEAGVPWAQGSAALVIARVLDMTGLAFWACVGLAWYGIGSGEAEQVQHYAMAVLAAMATGLLLMRPIARWAAPRLSGRSKIVGFLRNAAEQLARLTTGRLALSLVVTLATWCATYAVYWLLILTLTGPAPDDALARELDTIGFARSLVGTTGLHMTSVLPVNTVGGAGVWEAAWTAGYVYLAGIGQHAALISGVVAHLLNLVFLALLGALGYALRGTARPRGTPPDDVEPATAEGPADALAAEFRQGAPTHAPRAVPLPAVPGSAQREPGA